MLGFTLGLISYLAMYNHNSKKNNEKNKTLEKKEFKRIIKEIGFPSQGRFAEDIGVKATTFTTYKIIPSHIKRITRLALLAKKNGVPFEDIKESLKVE